ncbi:MAG: acetyl-CoA carboxylase carboxyl transferase subunit beta, partial [Roseburia sp.]|nr:acetyl-CoA carboxylase carboxyl transferase subunit beta [Roseburia sp.]
MGKLFENGIIKKVIHGKKAKEKQAEVLCKACGKMQNKEAVVRNRYVCCECGAYFRVKTGNRLKMVLDRQSFEEWFAEEEGNNPLDFPGYEEKIADAREKTGLKEAVTVGCGRIFGEKVAIGVCDSRFMM